ncbi:chondroadherin [Callorhinchus milii]|uniref:chondroadherin n=1 Tax=Callorhinchus milii TaxID=7868 RepID=UPI001C3FA951|nr:chondroadherin [Callorhinchus milii]
MPRDGAREQHSSPANPPNTCPFGLRELTSQPKTRQAQPSSGPLEETEPSSSEDNQATGTLLPFHSHTRTSQEGPATYSEKEMEEPVTLLLVLCLAGDAASTMSTVTPTQGVPCPSDCSCVVSQQHVTCEGGLTSIPEGLPTDTRELRLSSNHLPLIGSGCFSNLSHLIALHLTSSQVSLVNPGSFQGLVSLQYLHLDQNRIEQLEEGVFRDLTAVTYLHLANNLISALKPGLFSSMKQLNVLYLNDNQLTEIAARTFQGLTSLRWLYLSQNRISKISPSAFQRSSPLQRLHLDSNSLTNVSADAMRLPNRLTVLNLSNNKIRRLQYNSILRRLKFLIELDLDNTSLEAVSSKAFSRLYRLQVLNLRDNRLDTLYFAKRLKSLAQLRVSGNPWCCDCRLVWLKRWLQDWNETEVERVRCGSPDALSGLTLVEVPLQQLTCLPDAQNTSTVPPKPVSDGVHVGGVSLSARTSPRPTLPLVPAVVAPRARKMATGLIARRDKTADLCLSERIRTIAVSEIGESTLVVNWHVDRDLGDEYEVRYETGEQSKGLRMIGGVSEVELSELSPELSTTCASSPRAERASVLAYSPSLSSAPRPRL